MELAFLHRSGIITTLPFSNYASPIFAQKKPSGKLRLLVGLRKVNKLNSDDCINGNNPVSTTTDAAKHMASKKVFLQIRLATSIPLTANGNQRSIEMLAFNFASRRFAYHRLAQGLSRALSAFSRCMQEYLDKVIKADQRDQNVNDIALPRNTQNNLSKTNGGNVSMHSERTIETYPA